MIARIAAGMLFLMLAGVMGQIVCAWAARSDVEDAAVDARLARDGSVRLKAADDRRPTRVGDGDDAVLRDGDELTVIS